MIYPQKINSKNTDKIIKVLIIASVILGIILFLINKIMTPNIPWSPIANAGIIYIWITVIYSIKKNTNIAAHVLLQMTIISILLIYIDYRLNYLGWSIYIGIPIVLMISNITMLVLSVVCYKKYSKYVIYQLIIVLLSMVPLILSFNGIIRFTLLHVIAIAISLFNLCVSIVLSHTEILRTLICKFHI